VPSHSWEEVLRDILLEDAAELSAKIVGIQQDNFEHLSICMMENIRYVLYFHHELSLDKQLIRIPLPCLDYVMSEDTCITMDDLMSNGHPSCPTGTEITKNMEDWQCVLILQNHIPDDVTDELGGNNILEHVDDAGIVGEDKASGAK
jgi:hypothetical protein